MPEFGFKPRTPLLNERLDNTEIDMRWGSLLIEAKLTESNFQRANPRLVNRYRDLEIVFDISHLPMQDGKYLSYQLVRGTLAAYASNCSFGVLCDVRRQDHIETWYRILHTIHNSELRSRLMRLTWQELARTLPAELRDFLDTKYGIV